MKKVGLIIKKFFPTLKKYINYLMKVGYKELFINTVIIFCLIVLSAFVYVPINLVQDFVKETLQLFFGFGDVFSVVYYYLFKVLSAICAILAFMWLFNKRFETMETKTEGSDGNKVGKKIIDSKGDSFDLPKTKSK